MLLTMRDASSWNFASESPGSRFSTLNVPIEITSGCGLTRGDLAGEAVADAGGSRRLQELEVAEVVVEDADDRRGVFVADVQDRHRGDRVIDLDPLRVEVAGSDDDAAAVGANGRVRPVVRKNPALAVPIRGADDDRVVDLEAHPFEGLVEVDAVLARVEHPARLDGPGRVVLDDRRRRGPTADADDRRRGHGVARGLDGDGRADDLRGRQVCAARAARPELGDRSAHADRCHRRPRAVRNW